jgi:hypothetical protein
MRRALWAVSLLALIAMSCADGTDEASSDSPMAGTTAGGVGGASGAGAGGVGGGTGGVSGPRCGDGQIDMNTEQCDPPGATQLTCMDLGMQNLPGSAVACTSECRLATSMCGQAGMGGSGGDSSMMGGNGG